jgi:CRISPR-associated protein Csx10
VSQLKYYAITLITKSPLAMRADHAPEGAKAAPYITGTTLSGSLAAAHRLYYPDNDPEFEQLFLSGQVQYPDLYPASFKDEVMQNAKGIPVYPFPKTAQSCKRFSGFQYRFSGDDDDEECHGVRDSLFDWAMFQLADKKKTEPAVLMESLRAHKDCPVCIKKSEENKDKNATKIKRSMAMENISGYYRREEQMANMIQALVRTRLQTHTGINSSTGTVQDGILYNRQVFNEETQFWGLVKVADEAAQNFECFMHKAGREYLVRIGTGRSRGLGKVTFDVIELDNDEKRFRAFQERLAAFDATFRHTIKHARETLCYFALTLHSPAILRDPLLRYRGTIDTIVLGELLGLSADQFSLVYQAASTRRITGWNELWGTPRTNELAIDTGSVFLFSSELSRKELEQKLFILERESIGQRTAEGFGRVCVSDPFHLEVELR